MKKNVKIVLKILGVIAILFIAGYFIWSFANLL